MRRAGIRAGSAIAKGPKIRLSIGACVCKLDGERRASMEGISGERTLDRVVDDIQIYLIGYGVVAAIGGISDKDYIDGAG